MPPQRFTVRSRDGVEISVQKTGAGAALLLVHGALLNATLSWFAVMPQLAERFTVYAMDRRGRAPSGDANRYSLSLEADDIAGVVAAIAQPVILLAHSYGALAALEALDKLEGVTQAILYEAPGLSSTAPDSAVLEKLDRALAADNREEIVTVFLLEQIGAPAEALEAFKSSPVWPIVLEIASTLPREAHTVNSYKAAPARLAAVKIPTVILAGSETAGRMRESVDAVCRAIPDSRLAILEGQGHSAMMQAPDLFVSRVVEIIGSARNQSRQDTLSEKRG